MTTEIVINGRFLSRRVTGVERHGREILRYIGGNCRLETTRWNGVQGHLWEQFVLSSRLKPDSVLWSPANTGPLLVEKQALTIHDLSVLEHPEWFQRSFAIWYSLFMPILVKRARVLFVPSMYVRRKLIKRFGRENVVVTPNCVDLSRFHPDARQSQYDLPARYILFVGTLEPRKNIKALLLAWNRLREDFGDTWLVVVGGQGNVHRAEKLPARIERVFYLGYADEEAMPGIYAGAMLLVLPSLDEGFGLPALEAMASGTPALVSNAGALPELVQDAGLVFDLSDSHALARSIRQCLHDQDLRLSLKVRGLAHARTYSWPKTAELIWNTLNEI